jgi:GntR family transcriptional regulator / MocR family aminotransferase
MRHRKIVEAVQFGFGGRLRVVPSVAGLHVTAEVAPGVSLDVEQVVRRAETSGIFVHTLADFSADTSPRKGLVLGYGAIPSAKVEDGLRRLARCFRT